MFHSYLKGDKMKIVKIDCEPEIDPYHISTGALCKTYITVSPQDEKIWISQEYDNNSTSMDIWNGIDISSELGFGNIMDGEQIKDFFESDGAKELFKRIFDGHEVNWNGSNHVGSLSDDASAAWDEIVETLNEMTSDMEVWDVETWFGNTIDTIMSDEEIDNLTKETDENTDVFIIGDVREYLMGRRKEIKEESEIDEPE